VCIASVDVFTVARIKLTLANEKIMHDTTDLCEDGLHLAKLYDYDIILYDVTPSEVDGYKMLQRLRAAQVDTPILILSGLGELDQRVKFLRFGADDVLTKPFDGGELLARIQAIVRRSKGHSQSTIRTGRLVVNLDTRAASVDDQPINLTNREYAILELLSLRKGTTVTRETFLNQLYGGIDEPELKSMDVLICKLRKKLARATGGSHYIEAVWARGYVLRDPAPRSGNVMQNADRENATARHPVRRRYG
jgi:two-component system cell cycle response regulator CtrA